MSLDFLPSIPPLTIPGLSSVGGVLNNVPGLGNLTSLLGGDTQNQPPIFTQLPKAQQALTTKYSDPTFTGALQGMPPYIANAFAQYDQARVAKGSMPLTAPQTFGALKTAVSNTPATPPPHQNFWENIQSDIGSLVSSIPQLPFNLIKETEALPQAPQKLSEALGAGSIPGILQGLAAVPGLRMVPGVNTAAELFNDPGQLVQHPVFTALDVLPYAEPAIGAATEAAFSKLPSVVEARAAAATPEGIAAAATKTQQYLDAGLQPPATDPSALRVWGQQNPAVQWFGNTAVGQVLRTTFGPDARNISQIRAEIEARPPDIPAAQAGLDFAQKWGPQIGDARMAELTKAAQLDRNTVFNDPSVTDAERGMVNEYIDHLDQMANYNVQQGQLALDPTGEYRTPQEAAKLQRLQTTVDRYTTVNGIRNLVAQAAPATAESTLGALDTTAMVAENLRRAEQINVAQGMAHAYDAIGNDATPLYDAVTAASRDKTIPMTDVKAVFDNELANPISHTSNTIPVTDIHQQLAPYTARAGAQGAETLPSQVRGFIERGDYQGAVEKMRQINSRSTFVIPNSQDMLDSLIRQRDAQGFIDQTSRYSDRALAKLQRSQAIQRPSARWIPTIEEGVKQQLLDRYMDDSAAQQLVHDHLWSQLPDLSTTELNKMFREQAAGADYLRQNGITDPLYVHRVSPSQVPGLGTLRISDMPRTPESVRLRTFDATPYVPDMAIAMSDQAMGLLRERSGQLLADTVQGIYGTPRADLEARYLPRARAAAEAQPGLGVDAHLENIIKRSSAKYDPEGIFGHQAGRLTRLTGGEDTYIPKHVDKAMRQLFHDYNSNPVSRLFDPIMHVYRTAIIPLSVRSLMHHMFGAAFQIAGESDPTFLIRQWNASKDLIDSGEIKTIKGMAPAGRGEAPAEIVSWAKKATKSDQIAAVHQMGAGRWWRENVFNRLTPATDAAGNVLDRINQMRTNMDERLRGMAYLEGKQRALKLDPTLTEEQATQAGVALVRKSMQNWDRMTPMERQTIRMVLPFYGQMHQMLRYAFRYPMDHPFRVGVLDNFARNEVNDFGQALPSQLMDALFLGNPDPKTGVVNTLNLQQINPFRDLPGYFTMAGFTGASNPVIQSVLRAVGVDPQKGAPSLYPDVAYDPATGQLRPDNPALLSSFLTNLIPQTEILTAMVGRNDTFKQVLKSNPDAAAAMLQSSLGLPNLFKNVNPTVEATKAEVQRQTLQDQIKNDALRTGDWSKAQQFPGLAPFFSQLQQVMQQNPNVLKAYQTQVATGGGSSPALTPGAT